MNPFQRYMKDNEAANAASTSETSTEQAQRSTSSSSEKSSSSRPSTGGRNILSADVEIKGKVNFTNDLVVDGRIDGEINSDGSLTVGENARIKAEIKTRSVVIYGKVHGNITVSDRVELKKEAELIGDIKAATISIEAGAIFVGKSTVGTPSSQPSTIATSAALPKGADKQLGKKNPAVVAS